jgi:hypothetical protein
LTACARRIATHAGGCWKGRASLRGIAPAQRRQLLSSYLGNFTGMILVPPTILRMLHPTTPEEWFVTYALWLIDEGICFSSFAANASFLYVTGSLCFLQAFIAPLVSFYMPNVAGSLMTLKI